MSVPWYARPIEPGRWPWLWHALPGLCLLIVFVAGATLIPAPQPIGSRSLSFIIVGTCCWPFLALRVAGWRQRGGRPPMSIPGLVLVAAAMTVFAIPEMLWPRWEDVESPPALVSTTTRLCWLATGLLQAVGLYLILSYTRRPRRVEPLDSRA